MLGTASQGLNKVYQSVGKNPIGKKRVISAFNQEAAEIIVHETDIFGIIGVLLNTFSHIQLDHVMEQLEYIAYYRGGV